MADYDLDPGPQLPLIPRFPLFWRNLGRQHSHPDPFVREDALQPACHIPLLGIDCEDLDVSPALKRGFDFLKQSPFLGVDQVLVQITGSRDQEWLPALGLGIKFAADQVPEAKGAVRVSK